MQSHRLPGMSIDAETWQQLTMLAEVVGITRTDLIRSAIVQLVDPAGVTPVVDRISELQEQLLIAQQRLNAARAVLLGETAAA